MEKEVDTNILKKEEKKTLAEKSSVKTEINVDQKVETENKDKEAEDEKNLLTPPVR